MPIFIDDGKTVTRTIEAKPGFYPAVTVEYRRALAKKRTEYSVKIGTRNVDIIDEFERTTLLKHIVSLQGEPLDQSKVDRLEPQLRADLLDIVLSYTAEQELSEGKGFSGASA